MNTRYITGFVFSVIAITTLLGCSHYFQVTEPSSGKVYYTTEVDQMRGGAVRFKDDRTGDKVTLQTPT
jgi:hypothetical protein